MNTNIEHVRYVKLTAGESECTVDEEVWDQAVAVLEMVAKYTSCVGVRKVIAIKMVRAATCSSLREAKLMTEAYFEPKMETCADRGWYQYG